MAPSFFVPHTDLQQYLSQIMVAEARKDHHLSGLSPFPPTPEHAIHFYPGDQVITRDHKGLLHQLPPSVIIGPQVSQVDIAISMHKLLAVPMHEFYDESYDAQLFFWFGYS